MKTIIRITILSLLFLSPAIAGAQFWQLTGNSAGSGDFVGTSNLQDLRFATDGSVRMTLSQSDANLGLNAAPLSNVNFRILQNQLVGLQINSSSTGANIAGARFLVNTASSGTPFTASNNGVNSEIITTGSNLGVNRGFATVVNSRAAQNYGLLAFAQNAFLTGTETPQSYNIGARGIALNVLPNEQAGVNFGVIGEACGARINIGLYGSDKPTDTQQQSCVVTSSQQNWALYLIGNVQVSGAAIAPSDENLKQNITDLQGATEILSQISAKTYEFKTEEYDFLSLPQGTRFGLISQQVEEVLPTLVMDYTHPAMSNTENEQISPEVVIKGINYDQFIPILIAAFNEQSTLLNSKSEEVIELQSEVEDLQSQLQLMQQQMASMITVVQAMQAKTNNCCNDGSTGSLTSPAETNDRVKLLQNTPNPFDTSTRIDFTLPADANLVLELSDAQGRPLRTLLDGQMHAGPQSVMFDGSSLASGMYFYTVYSNGEIITKKMVKK